MILQPGRRAIIAIEIEDRLAWTLGEDTRERYEAQAGMCFLSRPRFRDRLPAMVGGEIGVHLGLSDDLLSPTGSAPDRADPNGLVHQGCYHWLLSRGRMKRRRFCRWGRHAGEHELRAC